MDIVNKLKINKKFILNFKMNNIIEEFKEIKKISFSVSSTEEIKNKSVYEAKISKYTDDRTNTVYDHRSGSLFNKKCETCKQYEQMCPGHFGYINLNATIVHPILFTHVLNILKCVCHFCSKLLITKEHLEFGNILKLEGERRISEIINKSKKYSKCFHCNTLKREYKIKKDPYNNIIIYNEDIEISDEDIKKIFDDIDEESISLMGVSHPKNCCLEVFPVIPPCCRPYEYVGNSIKEDDLTKQLVEIIKINNSIPSSLDKKAAINNLKLNIEMFCRTPKKNKNINNDKKISIRERLTGKDGQLRDNLMGKRTEMSARTVIGPGANLKLDEVGIPESIAKNITFPLIVYESNYNEILEYIKKGFVEKIKRNEKIIRIDLQMYENIIKFLKVGDIVLRQNKKIKILDNKFLLQEEDKIFRNGIDITPKEMPKLLIPKLEIGDIVQRRILNGDWVLMNRQPTLWKGSMMAFKVVISKCGSKTFTFNLAVCKAFNADFDGDEQNAHFPQSIESSIELQLLSTPSHCLLSITNGTPVIVVLQDALLGAYLMSKEDSIIVNKNIYNDIIMSLTRDVNFFLKRKDEIRETLKSLNLYKGEHSLRTGRSILSLIFPKDFNLFEEDLKIKNGVIYHGFLSKKYLGSSKSSFIYTFKMEYDTKTCVDFINDIQFMTNKWLLKNSFSVNISDCFKNTNKNQIVKEKLAEAEFIKKTILNERLSEAKINIILSNAKDIGMKIADDNNKNNFVQTIKAGSKGDYFNLGQVKGLLGQQIINGKRISKLLDNGTRTLIHYERNKELSRDKNAESQGFISNGFYEGINPIEFFFHACSGRVGMCDTAMTTSHSGYLMRKLTKLTEDIKIQNDGIVADSSGNVYSYAYGDIGFNPEFKDINIDRIISNINNY